MVHTRSSGAAQYDPFWAQLTAYDGTRYFAWHEVMPVSTTTFVTLDGGRSGTVTVDPAWLPNGGGTTLPTYVKLQLGHFDTSLQTWTYVVSGGSGGGAALEIRSVDPNFGPTFPSPTILNIDQLDFNLQDFGDGNPWLRTKFHGARVIKTNSQLLTADPTLVSWDTVDYDTGDGLGNKFFDPANPTYFTPWISAYYVVGACVMFIVGGAGGVVPPAAFRIYVRSPAFVGLVDKVIQTVPLYADNAGYSTINFGTVCTVLALSPGQKVFIGCGAMIRNGDHSVPPVSVGSIAGEEIITCFWISKLDPQ